MGDSPPTTNTHTHTHTHTHFPSSGQGNLGRAWVSNKLMEIETEGGRGPGKGGERPRSPTWSEGSPGCGCRAALEEDAYSRIKLVLRWYLSGFYKKPKVRAPSGEAWGSASGRSTQPRPRHPPLPAVGGEGHSPPQDCPRRSSEMGGRAQTSHPGTCWWGPAHRVVPIPERPELGPPHLRETAATQQCQEEDFGLRTSRNPGDPRVLGMKPLLRTKSGSLMRAGLLWL